MLIEFDPVSILCISHACIRMSQNEWKSMKLEKIWGAEEQNLILLEDQRTLINLRLHPDDWGLWNSTPDEVKGHGISIFLSGISYDHPRRRTSLQKIHLPVESPSHSWPS